MSETNKQNHDFDFFTPNEPFAPEGCRSFDLFAPDSEH